MGSLPTVTQRIEGHTELAMYFIRIWTILSVSYIQDKEVVYCTLNDRATVCVAIIPVIKLFTFINCIRYLQWRLSLYYLFNKNTIMHTIVITIFSQLLFRCVNIFGRYHTLPIRLARLAQIHIKSFKCKCCSACIYKQKLLYTLFINITRKYLSRNK